MSAPPLQAAPARGETQGKGEGLPMRRLAESLHGTRQGSTRERIGPVAVVQLGARMHYAVPRMLAARGELARLYTDITGVQGWPRLLGHLPHRLLPGAVRRLGGRVPGDIDPRLLTSFPGFGLALALRRLAARTPERETAAALWGGRMLARRVTNHGFGDAAGLYAFSGESLDVLKAARAAGLWTVVEQIIAPRGIVERLIAEEEARFPDWQAPAAANRLAAQFAAQEIAEWGAADLVICGSAFVRDAVIATGGDAARTIVVPYGVDQRYALPPRPPHGGPLRVLTVGGIGLRKGSPYVREAARQLKGRMTFRMVGPCPLTPAARQALARDVELVGAVPRSEIQRHYAWADVFLLPSICEGSATATYEALAAGLPVVTTPNAGSVVRDGRDGSIVPIRDVDAIVAALLNLAGNPRLRHEMAREAGMRAAEHDLAQYGERLRSALVQARALHAGRPASREPP
ncbi:Glycosyltransferase involved in cell wall biosynthesis [Chelatococcus asaccharovorans]|nr:Glycosyltransferase involved in cell wall biosynthesis [Chelatococcus asaccharovorans]CAH1680338.1 Glycosyltransferase involved in cell wall biosynthesis [Chelatococcus asaccharovorans]